MCIASETWNEHLAMLRKVLKVVMSANLRLKGSKCLFGAHEVIFLRHKISKEGVQQERYEN